MLYEFLVKRCYVIPYCVTEAYICMSAAADVARVFGDIRGLAKESIHKINRPIFNISNSFIELAAERFLQTDIMITPRAMLDVGPLTQYALVDRRADDIAGPSSGAH
jgi:hypothetical protein